MSGTQSGRQAARKPVSRLRDHDLNCDRTNNELNMQGTIRIQECSTVDFQDFKDSGSYAESLIKVLSDLPPARQNKKRRSNPESEIAAVELVTATTAVLPAYLPGGGLCEFPPALIEIVAVLAEDADVGGATVEEVLNNLLELGEVGNETNCINCNASIDLISFINEQAFANVLPACSTCVQRVDSLRSERIPKRVGSKDELELLLGAAKDAGISKAELKAPPKLNRAASYDDSTSYLADLMDTFDDGGKIMVFSGQACPIGSGGPVGISMDELVEEVARIYDPKGEYSSEFLENLRKGEELLEEIEKGDAADTSRIRNEVEKKIRMELEECFNPDSTTYGKYNFLKASPAMKIFREKYVFSKDCAGRGMKMAEHLGLIEVHTATLMFVGTAGAVTDMHPDRTEVINGLWAVDVDGKGVNLTKHYATWIFIHPMGLMAAEEHLRVISPGFDNFIESKLESLSDAQIEELIRLVGCHPRSGAPLVTLVFQKHGDLVMFPPATFHIVFTKGGCVKMAMDIFNVERNMQLRRYVATTRLFADFGLGVSAEDYMAPASFVISTMRKYHQITSGKIKDDVFESLCTQKW